MPRGMPNPNGAVQTKTRGGALPQPEGGSFNPFLKVDALGKKGYGTLEVTGVRDAPPDSFSEIVIEVKLGGKVYDWGMKFSSGNYRRLFERFGANPKKWRGRVEVGIKEYAGKKYVAAEWTERDSWHVWFIAIRKQGDLSSVPRGNAVREPEENAMYVKILVVGSVFLPFVLYRLSRYAKKKMNESLRKEISKR
jgi:hypothetical protein